MGERSRSERREILPSFSARRCLGHSDLGNLSGFLWMTMILGAVKGDEIRSRYAQCSVYSSRLETRTKEFSMHASERGYTRSVSNEIAGQPQGVTSY